MQNLHSNQKGVASVIILLIAAVLAMLSLKIIDIGSLGIRVNNEKHTLDTCGIVVAQKILTTNDIDEACSIASLQQCIESVSESNAEMTCEDVGLECNDLNECKRNISLSSTYDLGRGEVTKSINVSINEENHEIDIIDAAVIMLLDFSGSMQGNRITQLKDAVRLFISKRFNLSYSVVLYNSTIIATSNIGKSPNHDQSVLSIINNTSPSGGTNFLLPLQEAINQIQNSDYEVYYVLLISDGSPNEGVTPSKTYVENNILNIDEQHCIFSTQINPCISVFTLGVDNADINILSQLSGNTISQNSDDYVYNVNANQTSNAFNAIIAEIMCRIGPIVASAGLYVFNGLSLLEENIDYVFDNQNKILKFYDEEPFNICTEMLNNNANITLRWGNPILEALD